MTHLILVLCVQLFGDFVGVEWLESPLVRQLGRIEWQEREAASVALRKEGRAAFGRLVIGSRSRLAERSERCRVLLENIGVDPDGTPVVMLADFLLGSDWPAVGYSIAVLSKPSEWNDKDLAWFAANKRRMETLRAVATKFGVVFSEYWEQNDELSRWYQVSDLRRVLMTQPTKVPQIMPNK